MKVIALITITTTAALLFSTATTTTLAWVVVSPIARSSMPIQRQQQSLPEHSYESYHLPQRARTTTRRANTCLFARPPIPLLPPAAVGETQDGALRKSKASSITTTSRLAATLESSPDLVPYHTDDASSSSADRAASTGTATPVSSSSTTEAYNNPLAQSASQTWTKRGADWFTERRENINANELVNTGILVGVSLLVLWKLGTIDSGVSRGWTVEEVAARIPLDAWASYSQVLDRDPIATKAATSATVYTIGDIIAQRTEGTSVGDLDRGRILRSLLAGLLGHGPLSHVWYNVCDDFFDNVLQWTDWWAFFPKVVVDQATWGPFWNNTYILLLGLMKWEDWKVIWGDMKRTTVPLIVSGLKLWPLAHLVTYGLIPVENRVLWVDIVEIVWVTILATQASSGSSGGGQQGAEDSSPTLPDDNTDTTVIASSNPLSATTTADGTAKP